MSVSRHGFGKYREVAKLPCPYCGKPIAGGGYMIRHKANCPQRIYKAPIETLTYNEAKKANRLEEFCK